jgi:hypothetical protein
VRHRAQQLAAGLVDQVDLAAIGAQVVQLQDPLCVLDRGDQTGKGVLIIGAVSGRASPTSPAIFAVVAAAIALVAFIVADRRRD